MQAAAGAVEQLVRVTVVVLEPDTQAPVVVVAVPGRLAIMRRALPVQLAQTVVTVLPHQSQAHQSHAQAVVAVVATSLLA
jgi:hypothetical protein